MFSVPRVVFMLYENHFPAGSQCLSGCDTALHTLRYCVDKDWTFPLHMRIGKEKNTRIIN